jgi:hypothetical protein
MYMRRHVVTRWGKVRLTDIDSRAVGQWLAAKREEGLAPATVLKIKMIFSRSFELGARWGVADCDRPNPVRAVPSRPVDNARQVYVTAEEAARLGSRQTPTAPALASPAMRRRCSPEAAPSHTYPLGT